VPAEAVDLEAEMDEDGEELDFAAAEGEVLRALDLSFAPEDDDDLAYDDGPPPTDLSIRAGGSQTHLAELDLAASTRILVAPPPRDLSTRPGGWQPHLAELDLEDSTRILVSVPQDGSAALVVSSEGHDQLVDLLTGERQDDDVAAAYYRADRVQEPHHTFPVSVEPFPVLYDGEPDDDIDATVSFQATTLTLTAWTEETGWAEPGG